MRGLIERQEGKKRTGMVRLVGIVVKQYNVDGWPSFRWLDDALCAPVHPALSAGTTG